MKNELCTTHHHFIASIRQQFCCGFSYVSLCPSGSVPCLAAHASAASRLSNWIRVFGISADKRWLNSPHSGAVCILWAIRSVTGHDGSFIERTEGPGGGLADFEVLYTFGVEPLQQYLVELEGGRLQALTLA